MAFASASTSTCSRLLSVSGRCLSSAGRSASTGAAASSSRHFHSTARKLDAIDTSLFTSDEPLSSTSAPPSTPPTSISSFSSSRRASSAPSRGFAGRKPGEPSFLADAFDRPPAPYRLHAHCSKHNTILSLTRDLPESLAGLFGLDAYHAIRSGGRHDQGAPMDPSVYGRTVARTSCGAVGFKKGQRSSYEAATRATLKMVELIENLGTSDRKTKHGTKVRDAQPTSIELILKGFGQGREAVVSALQTGSADRVRTLIKRVTDATPIKIGGTRPRKRRKLSPPLDLRRKR